MFSNRSLGDVAVDGIANLRLEALRGFSVFSNRKAASRQMLQFRCYPLWTTDDSNLIRPFISLLAIGDVGVVANR